MAQMVGICFTSSKYWVQKVWVQSQFNVLSSNSSTSKEKIKKKKSGGSRQSDITIDDTTG
jgi:hypothetical protein